MSEILLRLERALGSRAAEVLPTLALCLATLLFGWLLSYIAKRVTIWAVRKTGLETLGERAGVSRVLYAVGEKRGLAMFLGRIAMFGGILLTLSATADVAGMEGVSRLGAAAVAWLPRLLAGVAVLVGGIWLGNVARRLIVSKQGSRLAAPQLVGEIAFYGILVIAITMAAEQAGLDTELVGGLIIVAVGATAGAVALSFALASRPVFSHLIARHYCASMFRKGDHISVGNVEGVIVRYAATCALVQTSEENLVSVPCGALIEGQVVLTVPPREAEA